VTAVKTPQKRRQTYDVTRFSASVILDILQQSVHLPAQVNVSAAGLLNVGLSAWRAVTIADVTAREAEPQMNPAERIEELTTFQAEAEDQLARP
jgi:hypothetical protein